MLDGSLQVRLAANSAVTKDIKESGDYGGFPAVRTVKTCLIRYLCVGRVDTTVI